MRRYVLSFAAMAALVVTAVSADDRTLVPGRNDAFPPVLCCQDGQRYLTRGQPVPVPTVPPVRFLLPPNTCGLIDGRNYCARGDGSLIFIW